MTHRRISIQDAKLAGIMCEAIFTANLPLIRRLLAAGGSPDVSDYDTRTPLHIGAAEGSLTAVKVGTSLEGGLVENRNLENYVSPLKGTPL